jgi:catechol 2,3-dioxygenase-like lactoylglutathione lyase family enzyme
LALPAVGNAQQGQPAPSAPGSRAGRLLLTRLNVRDLDVSLRFFAEGLGLREVGRLTPSKGTMEVSLGDPAFPLPSPIMLIHRSARATPYSPGEWGSVVMEVKDAAAATAAVVRAGGKVTRESAPSSAGPVIVAFVQDPDGHEFELVQFK